MLLRTVDHSREKARSQRTTKISAVECAYALFSKTQARPNQML